MFKCPISHRERWRKKRVLVQGSNPAQPSCWVFIKSRKQMDRHSCRRCCDFSGKGTCSMQEWQHSTAALPHSPCCSRRCVSDENPPGTAYSSQCGTLCLCSRPACSRGVKTCGRKMHQRLSCISAVCWRTRPGALTLLSSPEAPYCFRSLLNSPLQAGQLQNEEVLWVDRVSEARKTSGMPMGQPSFWRQQKRGTSSQAAFQLSVQPLVQSRSDDQSLLKGCAWKIGLCIVYQALTVLGYAPLLGRCECLHPFQNRSKLVLLFGSLLTKLWRSLVMFLLLYSFYRY